MAEVLGTYSTLAGTSTLPSPVTTLRPTFRHLPPPAQLPKSNHYLNEHAIHLHRNSGRNPRLS
jgi:hypothetical protein